MRWVVLENVADRQRTEKTAVCSHEQKSIYGALAVDFFPQDDAAIHLRADKLRVVWEGTAGISSDAVPEDHAAHAVDCLIHRLRQLSGHGFKTSRILFAFLPDDHPGVGACDHHRQHSGQKQREDKNRQQDMKPQGSKQSLHDDSPSKRAASFRSVGGSTR